jgi:S1-C subfamily serine protease
MRSPRSGHVRAAAITAALLLRASPALATNPRAETVSRALPSAVRLELRARGGEVVRSASGVVFAVEGGRSYLLTNAHVVHPDRSWPAGVRVHVLASTGEADATVLAQGSGSEDDLAVLEVPGVFPVSPLAPDGVLDLGDDLVVIGAPFGKGLSVAAGIVSQVEYEPVENAAAPRRPRALKTDAAIGYGSSGGGVFGVPGGRLIGLVEGYRTARVSLGKDVGSFIDVPMPGETFVAPASRIRRFLAEHGLSRLAGPPAVATPAPALRGLPGGAGAAATPASAALPL